MAASRCGAVASDRAETSSGGNDEIPIAGELGRGVDHQLRKHAILGGCSGRLGRGFGGDEVCASTSIGGEAGEGRPSRLRRCGRGEGGRRGCSREAREVAVLAGTAHVRGGEGPCAGTVEKAEAICSVCERQADLA
jgi:hypothetical protein